MIQEYIKKQCRSKIILNSREIILVSLILLIAIFFRFWDLGETGFNSDESIYSGQAANLAGFEEFNQHFSLFRAHPLLLQFFVSISFILFGVSDIIARIIPAIFGVMTVLVTYLISKNLFNIHAGLVSAVILSILPYHITMTRQVFVDIPLSFFYSLTLLFLIKYIKTNKPVWIYATGIASGLCFISKEIGLFSLISIIIYMVLLKKLTIKFSTIIFISFIFTSLPYLLAPLIIEDAKTALIKYYEWQKSRESSSSNSFYIEILLHHSLGYILSGLCIVSIIYMIKSFNRNSPYLLLFLWIIIPLILYHLLPIKGYNYLVSIVPPLVIMGSSILFASRLKKKYQWITVVLVIIFIPLSLGITKEFPIDDRIDLPTSGPEPYIREAAMWMKENSSNESKILTIYSNTANIMKFYSNREAIPLKSNQNPAYLNLENADLAILNGEINYLIDEPQIMEKSPFLETAERKMKKYISKHDATLVYSIFSNSTDNKTEKKELVSIYHIKD